MLIPDSPPHVFKILTLIQYHILSLLGCLEEAVYEVRTVPRGRQGLCPFGAGVMGSAESEVHGKKKKDSMR